MKDRLLLFLKEKSLSATRFADEIGVQRSSISHILSGRNKPSLDFIEKVLSTYKDLSAEWFLRGKGAMSRNMSLKQENGTQSLFSNSHPSQDKIVKPTGNKEDKSKFTNVNNVKLDDEVEKIVIFYKNKSFDIYSNL